MEIYRKYDPKECDERIIKLRALLKSMKTTVHEDNERVFNDLRWYWSNLTVFRRHKSFIEALDIIEELIYTDEIMK